jgi:hypothetical protein
MCSKNYKMVAFSEITVIEFPVALGDNPCCTSGAPIQLDWKPVSTVTHDLDIFEYMVKKQDHDDDDCKRSTKELRLSVPKRAQLLMNAGYGIEEIANAVMQVQEVQKQRAESIQTNGLGERMQMLMETTGRLPVGMIKGVLKSMSRGPKTVQKTVQARSA